MFPALRTAGPTLRRPPPSRPAGKPKKGRNQDVSVAVKAVLWLTVILVGGLGVLYLVSKAGDMMGKGF